MSVRNLIDIATGAIKTALEDDVPIETLQELVGSVDKELEGFFADMLPPSRWSLNFYKEGPIVLGVNEYRQFQFFEQCDAPDSYIVIGVLKERNREVFAHLDEWLDANLQALFRWFEWRDEPDFALKDLRREVCK